MTITEDIFYWPTVPVPCGNHRESEHRRTSTFKGGTLSHHQHVTALQQSVLVLVSARDSEGDKMDGALQTAICKEQQEQRIA